MNKKLKPYLYILFGLSLFVECYLVYIANSANVKGNYELYVYLSEFRLYVRPIILISLSPLIFQSSNNNIRYLLLYVGLLCSWLADILILVQQYDLIYIGLSLYTGSYIFITESFKKLIKRRKRTLSATFYVSFVAWLIITISFILALDLRVIIMYPNILLHAIILIELIYQCIDLKSKLESKTTSKFLLLSGISLFVSNLIYAIGVFIFKNQISFLFSITAFSYGLYLFLLIFGLSHLKEKQEKLIV